MGRDNSTIRVDSEESAAESIRDEIILSPYIILSYPLGYFILVA